LVRAQAPGGSDVKDGPFTGAAYPLAAKTSDKPGRMEFWRGTVSEDDRCPPQRSTLSRLTT
jgi:hypothetical protein